MIDFTDCVRLTFDIMQQPSY